MNTVTPAVPKDFAAELVRRGLPIDFASRVAEELADHHRDLVDEFRAIGLVESEAISAASGRLGDVQEIVSKTVREYRQRYWCGRRPLLTFSLGPLVLIITNFVAMVLVVYCIAIPLEKLGVVLDQTSDGVISRSEYVAATIAHVLTLFVCPAISLLVLGRVARKAAMGSAWLCLSTCILTLIVSCIWYGFAGETSKNLPADQGLLCIGVPILRLARNPMYVAQCLLPLAICAGMILRMWSQWRRAELLILKSHKHGGTHEYAKCA